MRAKSQRYVLAAVFAAAACSPGLAQRGPSLVGTPLGGYSQQGVYVTPASPADVEAAMKPPADRPPIQRSDREMERLPPELREVERHMNALGYSPQLRPDDVWGASPNIDPEVLQQQMREWNEPSSSPELRVQADDPRRWSWSREAGTPRLIYGKIGLSLVHGADSRTATLDAGGRVDGAILGRSANVATFTARLVATRYGTQSVNMRLDAFGRTRWSPSQSSGGNVQYRNGWELRGRLWTVPFRIGIAGFGVYGEIYQYGAIGWNLTANAYRGSRPTVQFITGPYVSTGVGGNATLDLVAVYARFEGEVGVTGLVLAGAHTISSGSRAEGRRWVDLEARFLEGKAKIKVKARNPFGSDPTLGTWTLWDDADGVFQIHRRIEDRSFTWRL